MDEAIGPVAGLLGLAGNRRDSAGTERGRVSLRAGVGGRREEGGSPAALRQRVPLRRGERRQGLLALQRAHAAVEVGSQGHVRVRIANDCQCQSSLNNETMTIFAASAS